MQTLNPQQAAAVAGGQRLADAVLEALVDAAARAITRAWNDLRGPHF